MLKKIKYVNHLNETVTFGEDGIVAGISDLRSFAWEYNSQFSKITSFTKKIRKKKLPFVIYGGITNANRIFEVFEKDVLAGKAGKLYIDNYYLSGYFYESSKKSCDPNMISGELSFVTDQVSWIKAVNYTFRLSDQAIQAGLGYEYDYPYDFTPEVNVQGLNNTSFVPCNFMIRLYGSANDPIIYLNGHKYAVAVELGSNEYLEIDSMAKTIIKTDSKGNKINEFANRATDSYIFEKVAVGSNRIITNQDMNYDIVLYLERSEPEWI